MNLFIDTNILLSFYHLSSDELEELNKLSVLLKENRATLYLPEQVIHEFRRNRAAKIADAIKRLRSQKTKLQIPQMAKQYPEFKPLTEARNAVEKNLAGLIDNITNGAKANSLEADSVIGSLFDVAVHIPREEAMVSKARQRADLGDPPGKKGSIRDGLNWEGLLSAVPAGQDLILISDDIDFYSDLDPEALNPYLVEEWSIAKGSRLTGYNRLSSFFRDHFPNIRLATELEKDLLIRALSQAATFAAARGVMSKLKKFTDFTKVETNGIVTAAISNNQIYWIANYPSVRGFLKFVVAGREDWIEPSNLIRIKYIIEKIKPYGEIPDLNEDEPYGGIRDLDEYERYGEPPDLDEDERYDEPPDLDEYEQYGKPPDLDPYEPF